MEFGVPHEGSMQMWKHYFGPQARIFGIDINPHCQQFEDEQVQIFIGDQEDRAFLKELAQLRAIHSLYTSMLIDELLDYLFDGKPHLLAEPVQTWLASSRRFTAFVTVFRNKIRKKMRVIQNQETLYDLRLELETAYLLLRERTLSLVYEPDQAGPGRSPDFAVTFTTSLTFTVEVTRLRATTKETPQASDNALQANEERLADVICSKLGQLLPQRSNVLIVGVDSPPPNQTDLQKIMLRLQQRAEAKDSALWQRYGFRERADFFRHYQQLSEVLVRGSKLQTNQPFSVWVNPQAKHPLPTKVRTTLHRSHTIS